VIPEFERGTSSGKSWSRCEAVVSGASRADEFEVN